MSSFTGHFGRAPVTIVSGNIITWDSDTSFDNTTLDTELEVSGTGNVAVVRLKDKTDNSDDYPYSTAAAYTYTSANVEITGGVAKLVATVGGDNTWPLTTTSNYTYNSTKSEIIGGVGKLKQGSNYASDLKFYLKMNGNADDSTTYGNDGTPTGMSYVAGKLGQAGDFNGASSTINVPNHSNWQITTHDFSISVWFYVGSLLSTTQVMIHHQSFGATGWGFYINSSDIFRAIVSIGGSSVIAGFQLTSAHENAWHHGVCTMDRSGDMKLYLDGDLKDTADISTLSGSLLNDTSGAWIGSYRNTSLWFPEQLDDLGFYRDTILSQDKVTALYNAGTGRTHELLYTDNPTIESATGSAFSAAINLFTETATTGANSALKYNLSSDDGTTYKVWNGATWATSSGTYTSANLASTCNTNVSSLAASGTFKWKAFLHSDDGWDNPELDNIYIAEAASYTTANQEVEANYDIDPAVNFGWLTFTETVTKPANTSILYQYSFDSGSTYNGTWLTAASAQAALIATGSLDKVRVKAQLATTDNNATPELSNINITSETGLETYGEVESNIYNSTISGLSWGEVLFSTTVPAGTSIDIYARAADTTAEVGVASYSTMNNETITGLTGKYIQWKAELSGTTTARPELDKISFKYSTPSHVIVEG